MSTILTINPGSTSTKLALFDDEKLQFAENLHHPAQILSQFPTIFSQLEFRLDAIDKILLQRGMPIQEIDCFVGRGGLIRPIPSGTYLVDARLLADLQAGVMGEHASNLGGILANRLATLHQRPAYIVDPVVVDELQEVARISGHPLLPRISIFHALNHKAVGRKAAQQLQKKYEALNLIVAHLGGGISIAAHDHGRVIDVNNALNGEGPFSPERAGTLPAGELVKLCFSGKYSQREIARMITGEGGMVAHLGTNDMRQVADRAHGGEKKAELLYRAMAYQIAKNIGAMAAVLSGNVDAIVLSGGIAHDRIFITWIEERVRFIAALVTIPGEEEMEALALGALRVLRKEEEAKIYRPEDVSGTEAAG